jgi:protein-L-isoaspartate(D-aspartate) O-methyltransferase
MDTGNQALSDKRFHGIGMTSARTRDRLIERLREEGIRDEQVLAAMRAVPRHIFVVEVGSGCGYQTAVLAALVDRVFSIERLASLVTQARERLHALGINNVRMRHADGFAGWPAHAPYDGILVAAAPGYVPSALVEQLELGGRLVIPVGGQGAQRLLRLTRTDDGFDEEMLAHVSFVPLVKGTG